MTACQWTVANAACKSIRKQFVGLIINEKSAAMVSKTVGFDAGKLVKGRKRFLTVDTLGLVLRVWVTAACQCGEERDGGQYSKRWVKQMEKRCLVLHLVWVDAAVALHSCDWVMDVCHWTRADRVAPQRHKGFILLPKRWVMERTLGRLSWCRRFKQRLRVASRNSRAFIYLMIRIMVQRRLA